MDDDADRSKSYFSEESTPMIPSDQVPSERPLDESGKRTFVWAIVGGVGFGILTFLNFAAGNAGLWNIPISILGGFCAGYVLAKLLNRAV